jgi:hypothetical protein
VCGFELHFVNTVPFGKKIYFSGYDDGAEVQ